MEQCLRTDLVYHFLDIFFLIFHSALTLFNLLGWTWKPLRRLNLITLLLTGASWFILGLFYGIGYCPFTDWHFQVLRKLGQTGLPSGYLEYLITRLFSVHISGAIMEKVTAAGFFLALAISLILNYRDFRYSRIQRESRLL